MKCEECNFTSSSKEAIDGHKQVEHKKAKVDIDNMDQTVMMCDQCDYKCRLNIQLNKHKKKKHKDAQLELKYNCGSCDFAANQLLHVWEHRQSKHPDKIPEFPSRTPKDMILSLIAEQNIDLIEEVETFRKDVTNSMVEFADRMEACFLAVGQDIKESAKTHMKYPMMLLPHLMSKLVIWKIQQNLILK